MQELSALPSVHGAGPDASIQTTAMEDFIRFAGFLPGMPLLRKRDGREYVANGVRLLTAAAAVDSQAPVRCILESEDAEPGAVQFSESEATRGSADHRVLTFASAPTAAVQQQLTDVFGVAPHRCSERSFGWRDGDFGREGDDWRSWVTVAHDFSNRVAVIDAINGRHVPWSGHGP